MIHATDLIYFRLNNAIITNFIIISAYYSKFCRLKPASKNSFKITCTIQPKNEYTKFFLAEQTGKQIREEITHSLKIDFREKLETNFGINIQIICKSVDTETLLTKSTYLRNKCKK